MKYIIAFLILTLPLFVVGQFATTAVLKSDSIAASSVISDLIDTWSLGINDEKEQPVDKRVFNKFKSLFDTNATIDDDFNVNFKPGFYNSETKKTTYTYQLDTAIPFDIYAHDAALQILDLKIDSVSPRKLISNSNGEMVYEIYREVTVNKIRLYVLPTAANYFNNEIKNRQLHFTNAADSSHILNNSLYKAPTVYTFKSKSTITITLKTLPDSAIKITSIKRIATASSIIIADDKDQDGVLISEDSNDQLYGEFTAKGLPDFDFDGTADPNDNCNKIYGASWNKGCPASYFNNRYSAYIFTGALLNSNEITLPDAAALGYADVDVLQSNNGSFKSSHKLYFSTTFGGNMSYYFGNGKKLFGLAAGLNYSSYSINYNVEESAFYTFKANDGVNDYRRRVTIKSGSNEEIKYQNFNVPLLFKYRHRNDSVRYWSYEVSFGPSVIFFNNKSKYNVNVAYEGLYQIAGDAFIWDDYFDPSSSYNLYITDGVLNAQSPIPGADTVFNLLNGKGYDFKNKNYQGDDKSATRISISINLNFDLSYAVNSSVDIKFGAGLAVAPLMKSTAHYHNLVNSSDGYNSYYRSKVSATYVSYGLHIGIAYGW